MLIAWGKLSHYLIDLRSDHKFGFVKCRCIEKEKKVFGRVINFCGKRSFMMPRTHGKQYRLPRRDKALCAFNIGTLRAQRMSELN